MSISRQIKEAMTRGSFIRRMFEDGRKLKEQYGADNVFDFSLGNPDLPPPARFQEILREEAAREDPMIHCYMPNAGYPDVREAMAASYRDMVDLPFQADDLVMTSGAGGGMNVVLKTLLEPGDEVLVIAPFFVEYGFYIDNHGGRMVVVPPGPHFQPDLAALEARITPRTRALIINSPNNPTGVVYPEPVIQELARLLERASKRLGRPVYLLSDEPYRAILFDGRTYVSPLSHYADTLVVTSNSKDLSLAGERIGHIAVSPNCRARPDLRAALTFCNRILGFVNANALMQRVVGRLQGVRVDVSIYQRRRDTLCAALRSFGFEFEEPGGAFYLFPRSPMPDDAEFAAFLRDHRVIVVPGTGFHCPGYFRISFAVRDDIIERSLPFFEQAANELGLRAATPGRRAP